MEAFDWLKQVGTVPSCFNYTGLLHEHYDVSYSIERGGGLARRTLEPITPVILEYIVTKERTFCI